MTLLSLHLERARELMKLALGVGISTEQSVQLIAAKLGEWYPEPVLQPSDPAIERMIDQLVEGGLPFVKYGLSPHPLRVENPPQCSATSGL